MYTPPPAPNVRKIAEAVAAALSVGGSARGESWTVKPAPDDDWADRRATLDGPGGGEWIYFSTGKKPGTLHLSAATSQNLSKVLYRSDGDLPGINVSATKTPAQIAAEINRRILPISRPLLVIARKRLEEKTAAEDQAGANAAMLAEIVGCTVGKQNGSWRDTADGTPRLDLYRSKALPEMTGDVSVYSDSVTFNRFSVSPKEAAAMLRALVACRKDQISQDESDDTDATYPIGTAVNVRPRKNGEGLTYAAFRGRLTEEARIGDGAGWDVVDVINAEGETVSVYSFSLEVA